MGIELFGPGLPRTGGGSGGVVQWAEQQIFYAGKHGNDANPGTAIDLAFLTFGAAVAAATALVPASGNRFAIVCLDSGIYTETFFVPSWINVYAPSAKIIGTLSAADDVNITLNELETTGPGGIALAKVVGGTSTTRANIRRIVVGATSFGALNLAVAGVLLLRSETIVCGAGAIGVGDITAAQGHTHVECEDIYLTGAGAVAVARIGAGITVIRAAHILEEGAGVGSGTALLLLSGGMQVLSDQIVATAAYNVGATGTLSLVATTLSGTTAIVAGGSVNAVVADTYLGGMGCLLGSNLFYTLAAIPVVTNIGQNAFDARVFNGRGLVVYASIVVNLAAAGTVTIRVYDIGTPTVPAAQTLVATMTAIASGVQHLTAALVPGAAPAAGVVQNANRLYYATIEMNGTVGDTTQVWTVGFAKE